MVALPIVLAGSIGNYGDLVSKVALWLDRDDLTDRIPDFVALLEARLNRKLRILNQEQSATWTIPAGGFTLPDTYRKLRSLRISGQGHAPLTKMSPQQVDSQFAGYSGLPRAYYETNRALFLAPSNGDTEVDAIYLSRIGPLTSENDSNWVLEEHPDCYLVGTLLEAAIYIRDADAISLLSDNLLGPDGTGDNVGIIAEMQKAGRKDQYGGGPLVPGGVKQVRGARC